MPDEQGCISLGVEEIPACKTPFEFAIPSSRSLLQAIKNFAEFTDIALFGDEALWLCHVYIL